MANKDAPSGLRPVRFLSGAPWNGQTNMYLIASGDGTATFVGDVVKLAGSAGGAGTVVNGIDVEGMPTVVQAVAGDTLLLGAVVGFLPLQTNLQTLHRAASTARIALVVDDPWVIYEVQEDGVTNTVVDVDIGLNADLIVAAGSTTTGQSAMELDSSTVTAGTANLRILRLVPRGENNLGTNATTSSSDYTNAKFEVLINEHSFKSTSGL